MRSLAAFLAGVALASTVPALAADVRIDCRPVFVPVVKCDPTALQYNRAPMACHEA